MGRKKVFKPISRKPYNPNTEQDNNVDCSRYSSVSNLSLSQDHQNHSDLSCQPLYVIDYDNNKTKLFVYDTRGWISKIKNLDTPKPLNHGTVITQLPNGELFCFGSNSQLSGIALIIDRNYKVRVLPSEIPCYGSSAIYHNRNIYCFGGKQGYWYYLNLSAKFDLNENRWTNLYSMPKADYCCHSVIFNGNIVISGFKNRNLLLYSIDLDSFSTICCDFAKNKRKILLNSDRIYLIECGEDGLIYESEVGDEYNWKKILNQSMNNHYGKTVIQEICPRQVYCSYDNQSKFFIAAVERENPLYYRFNLETKALSKNF